MSRGFVMQMRYDTVSFVSYTKPKGQIPDYDAPVVVPRDKNAVEHFCMRIHKSLVSNFK